MAPRRPLLAASAAIALLVAVPASAHTTQPTDDGRYCLTVGNQNEPVTTYVITGLELTVREGLGAGTCASSDRGDPVEGAHETLQVVIEAPGGATHTDHLVTEFGEVGRYEFVEPYVLTEPGEYYAQITGMIGDSEVDNRMLVGSGPIQAFTAVTFPADGLDNLAALQARIVELESEVEHLHDEMEAGGNTTPGPGPVLLIGALAVFAALFRNRPGA